MDNGQEKIIQDKAKKSSMNFAVGSVCIAISAWISMQMFDWYGIAFILLIAAVLMGHVAMAANSHAPDEDSKESVIAVVGLILGYVGLGLFAIGIALFLLFLLVFAGVVFLMA